MRLVDPLKNIHFCVTSLGIAYLIDLFTPLFSGKVIKKPKHMGLFWNCRLFVNIENIEDYYVTEVAEQKFVS